MRFINANLFPIFAAVKTPIKSDRGVKKLYYYEKNKLAIKTF